MLETKINKCRVCGNSNLVPCINLGEQYLSSIFPESLDYRNTLKKYPLELVLCLKDNTDRYCGLLQLAHNFNMENMYKEYPYTSSSNSSMLKVLYDVAQGGVNRVGLKNGDTVLDIGCNDGTLLSFFDFPEYQELSIQLLGIDAAENVKPVSNLPNFRFKQGFFSLQNFTSISWEKANLIFSVAMFYHLADPVAFCREVAMCMAEEGVWVIQMAYLPEMLKTNMYDNIVHEHVGYYNIETLQWLMRKVGLEIFDAEINNVYGGSFRVYVKKSSCTKHVTTLNFSKLAREERKYNLSKLKTYQDFSLRIDMSRYDLCRLISKLNSERKTIWVYGASTKGNTILQYCQINFEDVVAVADCNEFKIGKYMIGSDIEILSEEAMRVAKPDYLLVLPYSFTKDFMLKEEELVKQGTKFIRPLPYVKVLGGNKWL